MYANELYVWSSFPRIYNFKVAPANMIRIAKRAVADTSSTLGGPNLVDMPCDLKIRIVVEAFGRSVFILFGEQGLLLASLFPGDEVGFNNAVFYLSNANYRCAKDIRKTSVQLWKWAQESYREAEALGYLKLLSSNDNILKQCFHLSGDLLPPRRCRDVAPMTWWGTRWRSSHIVMYAGKRGKDHTALDIIKGLISCYDFVTDVLKPSGACDSSLHPRCASVDYQKRSLKNNRHFFVNGNELLVAPNGSRSTYDTEYKFLETCNRDGVFLAHALQNIT